MKTRSGFTLIEMLLVMAVISMVLVLGIGYMQQQTQTLRVEKTSLQMQQILNAGLAYYVVYGKWPADVATLQSNDFLPKNITLRNPWGQPYAIMAGPNVTGPTGPSMASLLYVYTNVVGAAKTGTAFAAASTISGKLPLSFTTTAAPSAGPSPVYPDPTKACTPATTTCYIAAAVNIPGQNLNNASAMNFAGVYNHGGCVPEPKCPIDAGGKTMKAQVFIVPLSVSGLNDKGTNNAYPISSFTAYPSNANAQVDPPDACLGSVAVKDPCKAVNGTGTTDKFWRACLHIVTEKGDLSSTSGWGDKVKVAAFTRCSITNEPSGSPISVWSN